MASQSLAVVLNSDQSKRFVFVASVSDDWKERILKEARNKFRIKKLSAVFLQGGEELVGQAELPVGTTQVWVSKGEPYAGPALALGAPTTAKDVRIIGYFSFYNDKSGILIARRSKSFIDDAAIKQLDRVAGLPGVHLTVGMPDLHPGNRFPIGCAIGSEGIYPALIGSDVGCGIALYLLSASGRTDNPRRLAPLLQGLDEPWSGSVSEWLTEAGITRTSEFDERSLGTVGLGNHFAEICTPEKIVDPSVASRLKIDQGGIYLLVHTGSRGLGASILDKETAEHGANPYIPPDSPHLQEYLVEHDYAVAWAMANRDLVAHRIKGCIAPGGSPPEKLVDVTHNSVTQHKIVQQGEEKTLWVHRKGAAPADRGIVPCPGSRGDFSWLLEPLGDGNQNAHSLAHGAGRRHGRQALHKDKVNKQSLTTTDLGSEVVCTNPDLLVEERPEAYKDIQCVVDDLEEYGVAKGVVVFRPLVTFKTRQ